MGPTARPTSQDERHAFVPVTAAVSRNSVVIAACWPGAQAPNLASCRDSIASSPKSSSFSHVWKAMSSSKSSAFSGACDVHPIARTSAVWNTTESSSAGRPSTRPNAAATAQVRNPFSKATPEARSVVSDSAASTSTTRIPATQASISTSDSGTDGKACRRDRSE